MDGSSPLQDREALLRRLDRRALDRAIADRSISRLRAGRYVDQESWHTSHIETHQRWLAQATQEVSSGSVGFSHITAAALHGLPLFRIRDDRVHTLSPDKTAASSTNRVFRHNDRYSAEDIRQTDGILVTSLARTVFDVVRTRNEETGISVMDAALRQVALAPGTRHPIDLAAVESLRSDIDRLIRSHAGARGIIRARRICCFGDPRAESPGESVTRLYLDDLRYGPIELQIPVPGPNGYDYEVDLGFANVLAEFDGEVKYTDPSMLRGRSAERVLLDEKRREEWIRARTGRRVIRLGTSQIADRHTLGVFLRGLGVTPHSRRNAI